MKDNLKRLILCELALSEGVITDPVKRLELKARVREAIRKEMGIKSAIEALDKLEIKKVA